jgi:tRNA-specific 2-thiouridylase
MTKVVVGMSGGVDSSVTAALLVEQGYDVTGVFMKNWTQDLPGMKCPWAEDLSDAKRVAVQLGIPFRVYDFQTEYRQLVVDYMIDEYKAGRTPNPDIMCNQEVKFKLFLDAAITDGADMIATGHYAQTKDGQLLRAADAAKDQTYFLYRVTEEALRRTLFPLGALHKTEVRQIAERKQLVTARKRDSQGICFVGSVGIKEFLSQFVETSPGPVVDKDTGKMIGHHEGALFYTTGQRHGLGLGGGLPYYVVDKDMPSNTVYVSRNLNDEAMWRTQVALRDVHWINEPVDSRELQVRLRHRGALRPATLKGGSLELHEAERAATAGQSAVLYDDQRVLGGGIIV